MCVIHLFVHPRYQLSRIVSSSELQVSWHVLCLKSSCPLCLLAFLPACSPSAFLLGCPPVRPPLIGQSRQGSVAPCGPSALVCSPLSEITQDCNCNSWKSPHGSRRIGARGSGDLNPARVNGKPKPSPKHQFKAPIGGKLTYGLR